MATRPNAFEQFMMLFNALKHHAGTPQRLMTFFDTNKNMQDALQQLQEWLLRTDFERRVFAGKKLFPQVPHGFETQWSEYKHEWEAALLYLTYRDILPEFFAECDLNSEESATNEIGLTAPDADSAHSFDPLYHQGGAALQLGIDMFDFELERRERNLDFGYGTDDDERFANVWRIATGAYDYLTNTIGIEPNDVFTRWRKVPEFFMPAHVSNKHGAEKGSLNNLLNDAIPAYVAGAPAAAIAMCRATLETILKEHYLPGKQHEYKDKDGKLHDIKLAKLIILAKKYKHIQAGKIRPLTEKANEVLHRYSQTPKLTYQDEGIVIEFMKTIKFLIDRADMSKSRVY